MAFNDDEKPPPPLPVDTKGVVTLERPVPNKTRVGITKEALTAMVEIKATPDADKRVGLDLVAVLDVSGRMAGQKMESMKKALQFVIMKLTPDDRLSIVTFSSTAARLNPLRLMTEAAKSDLKSKVDALLVAVGGTDIKAGLEMGLAVLGARVHSESRTANIFLMSHGRPDGPTTGDPRDINPGDVAVYTFGFGAGTDHKVLTDLARKSTGGTYNAVPDGNNLRAPFSQVLAGLLTVVVQDLRLTLNPNFIDGDLDKMTLLPGTDYTTTTDDKTSVVTIKFGTLFSDESRKVAIDFTLKETAEFDLDYDASLAEARLSYAAQDMTQPYSQTFLIRRILDPLPADPFSAGAYQRLVLAEVLRRQHAETICAASLLADAKKLEEAREKIRDAQNTVEDIMLDDGDKMASMLRAELLQLLSFMESQALYNERGHPYALATVLSHGRQRTAGRGDEGEVHSLYLTPRMVAYLEQAKRFEENPEDAVPTADDDLMDGAPFNTIAWQLASYVNSAKKAIQRVLAQASQRKR